MNYDHNTSYGAQAVVDDTSGPLTANELSPVGDPRYAGLNRAQRRKAIAHERRAFKRRGGPR